MSEENDEPILEHDWVMAQFTVASGALLAIIVGILIGILADQVPFVPGVVSMVFGSGVLFYAWSLARRRSRELRARLKARKAPKQR